MLDEALRTENESVKIFYYIDDLLIGCDSQEELQLFTTKILAAFKALKIAIAEEKSIISPQRAIPFLGLHYQREVGLSVSPAKVAKLRRLYDDEWQHKTYKRL